MGMWERAAHKFDYLQALAATLGAVFVVEYDGERPSNWYTLVLSGAVLGDEFFRGEGDDLGTLLDAALFVARASLPGE